MSFRHIVLISLSLLVISAVDLYGQYAQSAKEKCGAIDRPAYTPDLHFYRPLFQSNRTSSTKAPRKKQRASVRFVRPHFVDWNRFEKKWTKQRYVTQIPASRCYLCLLQKLIGDCMGGEPDGSLCRMFSLISARRLSLHWEGNRNRPLNPDIYQEWESEIR